MVGIVLDKNGREIQRVNNPTKKWITDKLNSNICQVFFRKRLNGQFRSIKCTRNFEKIPKKYKYEYQFGIQNPHGYDDLIHIVTGKQIGRAHV